MKKLNNIIKRCRAFDRNAQQQLYNYTYGKLAAAVAIYVTDNSEKDWLFNIGMLKILSNLDRYRLGTNYLAWARTLLVRAAIDHIRKSKKLNNLVPLESLSNDINSTQFDELMNDINTEGLIQLIQTLAPNEKVIFNLYEIEGYTHKEIEKLTGINNNTSKWLLSKAKKELRYKIEHSYISKEYGYEKK